MKKRVLVFVLAVVLVLTFVLTACSDGSEPDVSTEAAPTETAPTEAAPTETEALPVTEQDESLPVTEQIDGETYKIFELPDAHWRTYELFFMFPSPTISPIEHTQIQKASFAVVELSTPLIDGFNFHFPGRYNDWGDATITMEDDRITRTYTKITLDLRDLQGEHLYFQVINERDYDKVVRAYLLIPATAIQHLSDFQTIIELEPNMDWNEWNTVGFWNVPRFSQADVFIVKYEGTLNGGFSFGVKKDNSGDDEDDWYENREVRTISRLSEAPGTIVFEIKGISSIPHLLFMLGDETDIPKITGFYIGILADEP